MLRSDNQGDTAPPRPAHVQLRARRNPRLIAVGVLCVVLGALGAAALYSATITQVTVVALARDVSRGTVITDADLRVMEVPANLANQALPADRLSWVVGQRTVSDLPRGTLAQQRYFGEQTLPADEAMVGVLLQPGQYPSSGLLVGDRVSLVSLIEGEAEVALGQIASPPLKRDDGLGVSVDITLARDSSSRVATLAATGQLAVVALGHD